MRLNPAGEVRYRVRMAERYLEEARRALELGDYRLAVASSQMSVVRKTPEADPDQDVPRPLAGSAEEAGWGCTR